MPGGRPTWTPPDDETAQAIIQAVLDGGGWHNACRAHGVSPDTVKKYRLLMGKGEEVPEAIASFVTALSRAEAEKWLKVEQGAIASTEPMRYKLAVDLLKRRLPEYHEKKTQVLEGNPDAPLKVDYPGLVERLREMGEG